jgi:putative transposase
MRPLRNLASDEMYHIILRGNGGRRIFHRQPDFLALRRKLMKFICNNGTEILHYSILHTHAHFIMRIVNGAHFPRHLLALLLSYHHYYRTKYNFRGHLWHHHYRSIRIKSDTQLIQNARYVEGNAVMAGIVSSPEIYEWSSCAFYATGARDNLVTRNDIMLPEKPSRRDRSDYLTDLQLYIEDAKRRRREAKLSET